jgi:hypothetical protein
MTIRTHARFTTKLSIAITALILFALLAGTVAAQDGSVPPAQGTIEQFGHATSGEWNHQDDGRLNGTATMGGLNVYCVDQWKNSATSFAGGGIQVLDPQGEEMLFASEATINAAWAEMQQTGQYVTLALSARGWYGGAQVGLYLLPSGEYQVNATDEWAKPVEFRFAGCRNFTVSTGDGCSPGWDRDSSGGCVYQNLY